MASKRRLRRRCSGKLALSKPEAVAMAKRLMRKSVRPVNAYPCKVSPGHWHVGHQPAKSRSAIAARRARRGRK